MKKILLFATAAILSVSAYGQGQIGNSGFENWTTDPSDAPDNFNSFLSGQGLWAGAAGDQCDESNDVRPGSSGTSSCKIWSNSTFGIIANGNVTTGRINMGSTTPTSTSNYNISLTGNTEFSETLSDMPDSIVFWAKFIPNGHNQNARMKASLHTTYDYRDPEDAGSTAALVATAVENFPSNGGTWQRHAVPFVYGGPASGNTHILLTFTTNQTPGGGADNDQLWIDDVELIYNPAVQAPVAAFNASATTICVGESITFTDNSTNTPDTWAWDFGDGAGTSAAQNPSYTFPSAGTFTVELTASNSGGSDVTTQVITVNDLPTITGSGSGAICEGESVTISATGGDTYSWNQGLGAGASHSVSPTVDTDYTVTGTDANGCVNTDIVSVTVDTQSNPGTASPINACVSDNAVDLFIAIAGEDGGGTWNDDDATGALSSNILDATGLSVGTTYNFTYSFAANGACPAVEVTTQVTIVNSVSAGTPTNGNSTCVDDASFDLFGGISGYSAGGTWNDDDATGALSGSTFDASSAGAGTYDFTYTVTSGSCGTDAQTISITVNDLPTVTMDPFAADTVCNNGGMVALPVGSPVGGTYSGTAVSGSNFDPATAGMGWHTITYSYTDGNGCSAEATDDIYVDVCAGINDLQNEWGYSIYPNPAKDMFVVSCITNAGSTVTVRNIQGQVVESIVFESNSVEINTLNWLPGMYFIQIDDQTGNNLHNEKLVVQH